MSYSVKERKTFWLIFNSQLIVITLTLAVMLINTFLSIHKIAVNYVINDLEKQSYFFQILIEPESFEKDHRFQDDELVRLGLIAGQSGSRLTLIDLDGKVIYDSKVDYRTMENHRDRPEVKSAVRGEELSLVRHSNTLGETLIYHAAPYYSAGDIKGIFRVSKVYEMTNKMLMELGKYMVFGIIAIFTALVIFITALNRTVSRSIKQIREAAISISEGNYETQIPLSRSSEINDLSRTIRRMASMIQYQLSRIESQNHELQQLTMIDELTKLGNRRKLDSILSYQWDLCLRMKRPVSFLMMDIDLFKKYNDHLGHPEGDICLQKVSSVLRSCVRRSSDTLIRYGGEEFAVILPETDIAEAADLAYLIQKELEKAAIPHPESEVSPFVTLSIGVNTVVPSQDKKQEDLLKVADIMLYRAKEKGRNRVELPGEYSAPEEPGIR